MINHERALRIVLNDNSDFETMPRNISDITIHHRNIQTLLIELFNSFQKSCQIIDFQ